MSADHVAADVGVSEAFTRKPIRTPRQGQPGRRQMAVGGGGLLHEDQPFSISEPTTSVRS